MTYTNYRVPSAFVVECLGRYEEVHLLYMFYIDFTPEEKHLSPVAI